MPTSTSPNSLTAQVAAELPVAAQHLKNACNGICRQIDPEADYYMCQQLDCIANVAIDASLLADHSRFHNLSALCRLAFEARIHFLSAIEIKNYVPRKFIDNTREHIDTLKEMVAEPKLATFAREELQRHETYLKSLLAKFNDIPDRKWNVKEAAEEVGLLFEYEERYSILSAAIHNTPTGILTKDAPYIVAFSIVHLFSDVVEVIEFTVAPLSNSGTQGCLSGAWNGLVAPLAEMTKHRAQFRNELARFALQTVTTG
jgi:hypothetical protein